MYPLPYYTIDKGEMGVLNDFDLVSFAEGDHPGNERTGTILFMAIDLLEPDGQSGRVEYIYRHYMESFIWAFIWICFQYNGGKMIEKPRPLDIWGKVDPRGCAKEKTYFLNCKLELPNHLSLANRHRVWAFVRFLQDDFHARVGRQGDLQMALRPPGWFHPGSA
ncbi:hypothetical protein BS17DRAFT_553142 [Gyrodon lividus]|nr:hypothetical protein BS17DRAFT_553142 [Gyrodon lividus]